MAINYEELPVGDDVASLTVAKYAGMKKATICVESNSIRFTCDAATEPSDTVGMPAAQNETFTLETAEEIRNFRAHVGAIASPLVPAKLRVQYNNNDVGFAGEPSA